MAKITLDLPKCWIDLIEAQVRSGRHAEPRWVVAEALGLLEYELEQGTFEDLPRKQRAELKAAWDRSAAEVIQAGLDDHEAGRFVEVTDIDAFMDGLARRDAAA